MDTSSNASRTHNPQLIVALSENGDLFTELPGANGARRKVTIAHASREFAGPGAYDDEKSAQENFHIAYERGVKHALAESAEAALRTILAAQANAHFEIGSDGAPTQAQLTHWQKHCVIDEITGRFRRGRIILGDPACCQSDTSREREAGARERTRKTREAKPDITLAQAGGVTIKRISAKTLAARRAEKTRTSRPLGYEPGTGVPPRSRSAKPRSAKPAQRTARVSAATLDELL